MFSTYYSLEQPPSVLLSDGRFTRKDLTSGSKALLALLTPSGTPSYLQSAENLRVEAADLTGAVVQRQYLGVAVAVAVVGNLPQKHVNPHICSCFMSPAQIYHVLSC